MLLLLFIIQSQYSIGHVYMSAFLSEITFSIIKNGTPLIQTPMGHAAVSALSGLILEKVYEFFFSAVKNETDRYIQESVLSECP